MSTNTTQSDTPEKRIQRMPTVLRAYARDAARHIHMDGGAESCFNFCADWIEAVLQTGLKQS